MGYQESFRPITHLAESAGIKQAIEDYRDNPHIPEYCHYCCTARERGTGQLYACIVGQRCRVHIVAGIDLDDCIPYEANYADYYEDLDESLIEEAAAERPDLVERSYREVAAAFEREAERGLEREKALREEANACWPDILRLFKTFGPMTLCQFEALPVFEGHDMHNILVDLSWQGLVESDGEYFCKDKLHPTDKALKQLGIEEIPSEIDMGDKLILLLDMCGSLSTAMLSSCLGQSVPKIRSLLQQYIGMGRIVPEGRGRSRRYRLADEAKPTS